MLRQSSSDHVPATGVAVLQTPEINVAHTLVAPGGGGVVVVTCAEAAPVRATTKPTAIIEWLILMAGLLVFSGLGASASHP